jgi:hypothetical protein
MENGEKGQKGRRAGGQGDRKESHNGQGESGWIGVFNRNGESELAISLTLKDLGLDPEDRYDLKEIWGGMALKGGTYSFHIPADGCVFLKYKKRR